MTCRPAIEYALYADGAMPPDEACALELHMQTCDRCRAAVELLADENRLLSAVLRPDVNDCPAWSPKPLPTPAGLLRNIGATVAILWAPAWLISRHQPLRFVFPALLGAIEPSRNGVAAFALLLGIGAAASWLGLRRVRGLALILLLLAALAPARAITRRTDGAVTVVAAGETVNDSLFAAGEIVRVEGVVAGDLFAFGRHIEIRGAVHGNVYLFGKEVEIGGTLERNLYVWAESIRMRPEAHVTGKVIAAGESATLAGAVGGPLDFYGERLNIEDSARIAGPSTAAVDDRSRVRAPAGLSVSIEDDRGRYQDPWFYVRRLGGFVAGLLAAFVAARLAPMAVQESVIAVAAWWRSLATGLAAALVGSLVIVLAAVTLIGLPVAAVLIALFALALYGAKVLVGDFAGRILLPGRGRGMQLACGLALVLAAVELPFGIGSAIWVATALVGLGAITSGARRYFRIARIF